MKKTGTRPWITNIIIPEFMFVAVVVVPLLFADRLPDPVARHWDFSGQPNGASPLWVIVAFAVGILALVWAMLVVADRRGTSTPSLVAFVYFIGATLVGVQILTVWANLDAPSWESAEEIGLIQIAAVLGAAILVGLVGWFLAGGGPAIPYQSPEMPTATVGVEVGERAVWVGWSESHWMPVLGLGFLIAAAVVLGWIDALLLAISILAIVFSAAHVAVSDQGVGVGLGWWRWPRKLIPLDDISRAEVLTVEPMSFGGWGLRVTAGRALTGTWVLPDSNRLGGLGYAECGMGEPTRCPTRQTADPRRATSDASSRRRRPRFDICQLPPTPIPHQRSCLRIQSDLMRSARYDRDNEHRSAEPGPNVGSLGAEWRAGRS